MYNTFIVDHATYSCYRNRFWNLKIEIFVCQTSKVFIKLIGKATIIVLAIALSTDALEDTEIPVSYSIVSP